MLVLLAHAESSLTDLVEVRPKIDHNNFLYLLIQYLRLIDYDDGNILSEVELPCCISYDLGKTIQFLLAPKLLVMVIQNFLH